MAWYDPGYAYRRAITVDNTGLATALSQFQVQISLTSGNFDFTKPLTDGSDLRVTDSDQVTLIPYWVQGYDHVAQTATIWVRVPSIAASATHTIYLYYGNASPATFTLPPTGQFHRPTTSVMAGLGENMVFDAATSKYYVVYTTLSNAISIASATAPGGPWTDLGNILTVGGAGTWDDSVVYAPCLFLDSGTWYLYYSGSQASPNADSIGYATASAVTGPYTKSGSNPVISHAGSGWETKRACEPYVYHSSILGAWVCLYMGDSTGGSTPTETVGYATASAPTGPWTKYASNPTIPLGSGAAIDGKTVADPWCVEQNGVAYIGYTGSPAVDNQWCLCLAVTTDYITFTKVGSLYGLGALDTDWDSWNAFRGGPLLVSGTWYLPYTGSTIGSPGSYGWAVASMPAVSTAQGYDPWCVLDFWDDFPGSAINNDSWGHPTYLAGEGGAATVASSILTTSAVSGGVRTEVGRRLVQPGQRIEIRAAHPDFTANNANIAAEHGLGYDDDSQFARIHDYDTTTWQGQTSATGGGGSTVSLTPTADTSYHTHTVNWVSDSSVTFQVDGSTAQSLTTNLPTAPLKPWLYDLSISGAESQTVDWVRVRKYAATDPAISVGSQTTNAGAAIAATGSSTTSATAAVTQNLPLAGTALGTTSASATVTETLPIVATASGTTSGQATITLALPLAATGTGTTSATATVTQTLPLTATATVTTSATATVTPALPLSGTASGTTSATATVTPSFPIATTASGMTSGTADVTIPGSTAIAATGTGTTSATASVTAPLPIAAVAVSTTSGTADVALPASNAIVATGVSTTSGSAGVTLRFAIAASAAGSTTATALAQYPLLIAGTSSGVTSGLATIQMALVLAAAGVSTTSGTVTIGGATVTPRRIFPAGARTHTFIAGTRRSTFVAGQR